MMFNADVNSHTERVMKKGVQKKDVLTLKFNLTVCFYGMHIISM